MADVMWVCAGGEKRLKAGNGAGGGRFPARVLTWPCPHTREIDATATRDREREAELTRHQLTGLEAGDFLSAMDLQASDGCQVAPPLPPMPPPELRFAWVYVRRAASKDVQEGASMTSRSA
jgi:hypothetical protein